MKLKVWEVIETPKNPRVTFPDRPLMWFLSQQDAIWCANWLTQFYNSTKFEVRNQVEIEVADEQADAD